MELSLFLGKLFGFYFFAMVLMMIVSRKHITEALKQKMNPVFWLFAGAIVFLCGLALVLSHNIWTADWRVVITLFGWGILIKGLHALLYPEGLIAMAKKMNCKAMYVIGPVIFAALGIYLLMMVY